MNAKISPVLIESLLDSRIYPHPVNKIQLIETHISWVILTGTYVYKIKKPVDFGFLDYSSLEKRKHYCEEELRLNRRFSDSLYLDVVGITGTASKPEWNGAGEVIEYAVKMAEFPQHCLLINRLDDPGLKLTEIIETADQLASFHSRAMRSNSTSNGSPAFGSTDAVLNPALENLQQIRPLLRNHNDQQDIDQLQQWTLTEFHQVSDLIEQRRIDGYVRECHGDLHLGNIALIDNQITFFDCIEFNDQLRWLDTLSELAYLLMDLESHGQPGLANRLLNQYLEQSGDYPGLKVLRFYKVYRALVKAKVNILRLQQSDAGSAEKTRLNAGYHQYIRLSARYRKKSAPFLLITHGVSGSGKSTISAVIAAKAAAIRIRSDVERKRLFGLRPTESSSATGEIYTRAATRKTFAHMLNLATELLQADYPVIADACFLSRKHRDMFRQLALAKGVAFIILDCQTDYAVLEDRLTERKRLATDASEAGIDVMQSQLRTREPLGSDELLLTEAIDTQMPFNCEPILAAIDRQLTQ